MTLVPFPIPLFFDADGEALEAGYIFIGTVDLDARENPIDVFLDAAMTIPVAQPIRTSGGYPMYQGSPFTLNVAAPQCSVTVLDHEQRIVLVNQNVTNPGTTVANGTISPEQFGAVGDGVADDRPAVQACFDYLEEHPGLTILFNPVNYYSIQSIWPGSGLDQATDVGLVLGAPCRIIGCGKERVAIQYDGETPLDVLLYMKGEATTTQVEFLCIQGQGEGAAGEVKIIVRYTDTKFTMWRGCQVQIASEAGFGGFNWGTSYENVVALGIGNSERSGYGFGDQATVAYYRQCYALFCNIGFKVFFRYGGLYSCACDFAYVAYQLLEPWSCAMDGCGAEACMQGLAGARDGEDDEGHPKFFPGDALAISVNGFHIEQPQPSQLGVGIIAQNFPEYNAGDTMPLFVNDMRTCKGTITGLYCKIYQDDGKWLAPSPSLTVDGSVGRHLIAGLGTYPEERPVNAAAMQLGGGTNELYLGPDTPAALKIEFPRLCCNQILRHMDYLLNSNGPVSTDTDDEDPWTAYGIYGAGPFKVRRTDGSVNPNLVFSGANFGFILQDNLVPIIFDGITFTSSVTADALFQLENTTVIFKNCTFTRSSGATKIFKLSDSAISSQVTILVDKTTMDNMSGGWDGLVHTGGDLHRGADLRATGYTAIPTVGVFTQGMKISNEAPNAGGVPYWECVAGGAPGTIQAMAVLS